MISHIVLVKFISEATEEQKQFWRDEVTFTLGKIPEVKEVRVGAKVVIPASASLDGGWDDGAICTLDNFSDYEKYVFCAAHDKYRAATDHLIAGKLIFDIES